MTMQRDSVGTNASDPAQRTAAAAASLDELLQALATDFEIMDNDSGGESSSMNGYMSAPLDDSYGALIQGSPLMTGNLAKLNERSVAETWTSRHFVLTQDGKLFLFKTTHPQAATRAATYLPVSTVAVAAVAAVDGTPHVAQAAAYAPEQLQLRVGGAGVTAVGEVVARVWMLRAADARAQRAWHRALARAAAASAAAATLPAPPLPHAHAHALQPQPQQPQSPPPPQRLSAASSLSSPASRRTNLHTEVSARHASRTLSGTGSAASSSGDDRPGAIAAAAPLRRSGSHGERINGLQRAVRDVNIAVRRADASPSSRSSLSSDPAAITTGAGPAAAAFASSSRSKSVSSVERRKQFFSMPSTETEEARQQILARQQAARAAELMAKANAERERAAAIAEQVAVAKKAREAEMQAAALVTGMSAFKIM